MKDKIGIGIFLLGMFSPLLWSIYDAPIDSDEVGSRIVICGAVTAFIIFAGLLSTLDDEEDDNEVKETKENTTTLFVLSICLLAISVLLIYTFMIAHKQTDLRDKNIDTYSQEKHSEVDGHRQRKNVGEENRDRDQSQGNSRDNSEDDTNNFQYLPILFRPHW